MPALPLQALRQRIASRDLAPVHLLLGDDVRLVERLIEAMEATIEPADRPFAVDRLHAGEPGATPPDIVAAASTPSLLGGRRLVFVLRAEKLLKPKRGGKSADAGDVESEAAAEVEDDAVDTAALEEYVESPSDCSSLILVAADIDRGRKLGKRVLARAQVTEVGPLAEGEPGVRGGWIQEEVARHGRTIEPAAMKLLVGRAGGEIGKLRGDVERLILFTEGRPKITVADVREVVSEEFAPDDWGVVNAIAAGDAGEALVQLGRRLDEGNSPHQIVGQLRWWVSTRLAEGEPARVGPALEALLRTDLALKGKGVLGEDRVLLERLVVELTGRPLSRPGWRK